MTGRDGHATRSEQALRIALDADLQEAAGRAYSSLQEARIGLHRFDEAERYYAEGMAYCEDRELGVFSMCLNGWRARALLLLGRWDEAADDLRRRCWASPGISPVNRLNPLRVLGTIRGRRGDAGGLGAAGPGARAGRGHRASREWIVAGAGGARGAELAVGPSPTSRPPRARVGLRPRAGARRSVDRSDRWPSGWRGSAAAGACQPGLPEPYALETRRRLARRRRRPGTGSAGPTTPPWPGWAPPTRPGSGMPSQRFDDLGARPPRPRPGGG